MTINAGEEKWFCPGNGGVCLLAVKVRVEGFDEKLGGYWIDEPTLGVVEEKDLLSFDEALQEVHKRTVEYFAAMKSAGEDDYEVAKSIKPDLLKCRAYKIDLIHEMWKQSGSGQRPSIMGLTFKKPGKDWIAVADKISEWEVDQALEERSPEALEQEE